MALTPHSRSALRRVHAARRATILVAAWLAGCVGSPAPPAPPLHVAQQGDCRLELRLTPAAPRVGDEVTLTLDVFAPDDFTVEFPFADAAAPFVRRSVVPSGQPLPTGWRWRALYVATPLTSDALAIPALTVRCGPTPAHAAESADAEVLHILNTPAYTWPVISALQASDDPLQPRDIALPDGVGAVRRAVWPWLAASAVALALLVLAWWLRRRRTSPPLDPLAEVRAALIRLAATPWHSPPQVYAWHYALTGVLRHYIQRVSSVTAERLTTRELLRTLIAQPAFPSAACTELGDLLRACDDVKYAAAVPPAAARAARLASAEAFVSTTAPSLPVEGRV